MSGSESDDDERQDRFFIGDDGDLEFESDLSILDAIISTPLELINIAVEGFRAITLDPVDVLDIFRTGGDIGGVLGQTLEEVTPADEAAGVIVDTAEELVISPLQQQGEITPDNVEGLQDDLEGNASALLLGIVLLTLNIEAATGGQFEEVPAELFGVATALGFDDVTGREIDARLNEGTVNTAASRQTFRTTLRQACGRRVLTSSRMYALTLLVRTCGHCCIQTTLAIAVTSAPMAHALDRMHCLSWMGWLSVSQRRSLRSRYSMVSQCPNVQWSNWVSYKASQRT